MFNNSYCVIGNHAVINGIFILYSQFDEELLTSRDQYEKLLAGNLDAEITSNTSSSANVTCVLHF